MHSQLLLLSTSTRVSTLQKLIALADLKKESILENEQGFRWVLWNLDYAGCVIVRITYRVTGRLMPPLKLAARDYPAWGNNYIRFQACDEVYINLSSKLKSISCLVFWALTCILSYPILSDMHVSCPCTCILSYPILTQAHISCPILFYPELCAIPCAISCSVLSYPLQPWAICILSYRVILHHIFKDHWKRRILSYHTLNLAAYRLTLLGTCHWRGLYHSSVCSLHLSGYQGMLFFTSSKHYFHW